MNEGLLILLLVLNVASFCCNLVALYLGCKAAGK